MSESRRKFLTACMGAGAFAALGLSTTQQKLTRQSHYLFGTIVDITVSSEDKLETGLSINKVVQLLQKLNTDWHPWQPGIMSDINQAIAYSRPISIDRHVEHMIAETQQLHCQSGGLFNPAIGRVVAQWGFHGNAQQNWKPPETSLVEEVLSANPSPADLSVEHHILRSSNPAVKLDWGGYAKGYAINLGIELLKSYGIENAIINAGGDLVSLGNQENRPWRIGIRHPQRRGSIAWLETAGKEAVFTSGNYERYNEADGVRYPHIIDPRNGHPVNDIASATVIHENAAVADAAATALVVAGTRNWQQVASDMKIEQAMVIDEKGGMAMTAAMKPRIEAVS